jgi:thymidylate kinase
MSNKAQNFKKLIGYFKDQDINYAVLGRKNSINEIIDGDIDIVVSQKTFKKIGNIIDQFGIQSNMKFIQCFQHESTAKYTILSDNLDHSIICPDICSHFVRNKRLLIRESELLKNKHEKLIEGFPVNCLNPRHEFLYYFLKKIDKKELGEREFQHLSEQFNTSRMEELAVLLKPYFFKDTIEVIINIFKNQKEKELNILLDQLRVELHNKKKILFSFFVKDVFLKFKRVIYRTGLSIAILGLDGSGKSTVINGVKANLYTAFRRQQYYHLIPVEISKENKVNTNPQGEKPYSFFVSFIKLLYLIFKYNLGYVKVYLKLIKSTFVIFDRYFDDILIDKLRFRFKGPRIFLKVTTFLIPKPKIYIYLDTSGEVAFKRKNELSVEELNRQRIQYLTLIKTKKNGYIIDAEQNLEKVIFDTEKCVLSYLNDRQRNRN